ncbi:MAG: hypothetical protein JXA15_13965 [Spirochaetales bacterium]|nr:hypothetical protein [Spirochaetales bacterium]
MGERLRADGLRGRSALLLAVLAASAAIAWAAVLMGAFSERRELVARAGSEVERLAQIAAEQTAGIINEVKVYLLILDTWLSDHPDADPRVDARFVRLVDQLRSNARFRIDIRLVSGDDGLYYVPSADLSVPLAAVGDREYVLAQKRPETRGLYVAGPVLSRVTGLWGIPVSYPLSTRNAGMALIFAAIELPPLHELYETIRPRPDGSISLMRSDGILMTRLPFREEDMGRDLSSDPAWAGRRGRAGLAVSPLDGRRRIISFHAIPDSRLEIGVAAGVEEVLAPWEASLRSRIAALAGATAILLMLGLRLLREWRKVAESNRDIGELNAELERSIALAKAMLGEKDLIIRETNHRVKNHLAQIVSLVDLSRSADPSTALGAIKSRILGYALLYEKLSYREGDADELDLAVYLRELVGTVVNVTPSAIPVDFRFEAAPTVVSLRKCTSFGLVVAELVTNSIKHAGAGRTSLALGVSVAPAGEGRASLTYTDDGPGFDWTGTMKDTGGKGIGMILIDTMLAQYGGNIEYSGEDGSRFTILM